MHVLLEVATGRKAVLQPGVEYLVAHLYQALFARLLTILQGIESIEQHAAAEAQLHMVYRQAVVATQSVARVIFQLILVYIALAEVVGQLGLHLLGSVERTDGLRVQLVHALLPCLADKLAIVLGLALTDDPRNALGLTLIQACKGCDGRSERQFADVATGGFYIGIAEGQLGLTRLIVEAQVAY